MSKHSGRETQERAAGQELSSTKHRPTITPPPGTPAPLAECFNRVVADYPSVYFSPSDAMLLLAYCEANLLHEQASRVIRQPFFEHIIETDRGTLTKNPWLAVQKDAAGTMAVLAQKLRICPSARTPHNKNAKTKRDKGFDGGSEDLTPKRPMFGDQSAHH
jgi:phage terminase small subunit